MSVYLERASAGPGAGEGEAGASLHRVLFPVGQRQRERLRELAGPDDGRTPEAVFLAWHRGIAQALAHLVATAGPDGRLADWLLVRGEGAASDLLWGGDPDDPVTRAGRAAFLRSTGASGSLGESYCRAVAPDLRHRLGEHYTPDWLVRKIVAGVPAGAVVADPACGDGRFLVALLTGGHDPARLWGVDLNPLAVVMARWNVWLAAGRPPAAPPTTIAWADFVLGPGTAGLGGVLAEAAGNLAGLPEASWYLGNPPWVTWRNLSDGYRAAVAARMAGSRLHHTRGWAARVSAGQVDLAHVFVHEAVERVTGAGSVGFVLPRTTFKAPVGPGRLREGRATSGRPYRAREVWDCDAAEPFTGVRADAVVGFFEVDQPPAFPVRWSRVRPGAPAEPGWAVLSDPADPGSPWLTGDQPLPLRLAGEHRWTGLRARGGVNTGGGNSAFHVRLLTTSADTAPATVTVRNLPSRRLPAEVVTAEVESEFVRPLLRGRDVTPWRTQPSRHLVLPHDPADLRNPLPEPQLARAAPLTYAYLRRFRELLSSRPELRRWDSACWYSLFRIGPYTAGCWRVVWPHSGNGALRAAVLPPQDRTVPDQKVVLVPFETAEPALFLCALLNCAAVRRAAAGSAGMDASPNLIRRLVLPRFEPADPAHQGIVELARRAVAGESAAGQHAALAAAALFRP